MFSLNKHRNKVIGISFFLVLCLTILTTSTISTSFSADVAVRARKAGTLSTSCYKEPTYDWAWMSGNKTIKVHGVYGTKGVPDTANYPGARDNSVSWTDTDGNLWLFGGSGHAESGGEGFMNDLWRFDCIGEWHHPPGWRIPGTGDDDDDDDDDDDNNMMWPWLLIIFGSVSGIAAGSTYVIFRKKKEEPKLKKKLPEKKKLQAKKKSKLASGYEQKEERLYENIFIQSSNLIKLMLIDFNDNSKIYDETFDPIYFQFDIGDLKLKKILSSKYEKETLIENTFKFKNKTYYYYYYISEKRINLILVSRNRIDNSYYEFIKRTSDKLTVNYKKIKGGELKVKTFLDENMFINFSRSYTKVSLLQNDLIEKIFQDPKERDFVRTELIKLPVETFSEFIKLHEQHIKELKLEKLKNAINNIDYFHERGFN